MPSKIDLAKLVRNAREIRGLTQDEFAAEIERGQSLVSKYERGLVDPPGEVIMHCVTITRGETEAFTTAEVARLVEDRLGSPEFAKLRSAIAAVIRSVPPPTAQAKLRRSGRK